PEESLPYGSDGFRGLLESFVLRAMQESCNVQQNDETPLQLAHTSDVSGFAFRKDTARGFDVRGRNLEHFRSRIDDKSNQFVVKLDDENPVLLIGNNLSLAEPFTEIHNRNDFPAEVDDALNQIRRTRDRSNFRNTDNLAHSSDTNAVRFIADAEAYDLKILFHREVSRPLGTRQFGVFNFL